MAGPQEAALDLKGIVALTQDFLDDEPTSMVSSRDHNVTIVVEQPGQQPDMATQELRTLASQRASLSTTTGQ